MVLFLVHFVFKRKSQSMLCRFICDKRLTYNSFDLWFCFRVFIYTLNNNSYLTVKQRLCDAWLLYRH